MIRIILKGSCQITENDWQVYYQTVEIENEELEKILQSQTCGIVGGEIIGNIHEKEQGE